MNRRALFRFLGFVPLAVPLAIKSLAAVEPPVAVTAGADIQSGCTFMTINQACEELSISPGTLNAIRRGFDDCRRFNPCVEYPE